MLYADMNILQMLFIYVINVCSYASRVYICVINACDYASSAYICIKNKYSCVSLKIHNYIVPIMVKISKIY
jgi:hypothetical protein